MEKLEEVKQLLLSRRNKEFLDELNDYEESEGYLDINDWCGGNIDDAYQEGIKTGEAELIEKLLKLIGEAS